MPRMSTESYQEAVQSRGLMRIDTLIRLRWYAIIGQAGAVLAVAFGFKYSLPWVLCLFLIAMSAALNVVLARHYKSTHRLLGEGAFRLLAFDVLQLGVLLFLTGGLHNPFMILIMAPVVVSSTSLRQGHTLALGALAVAIISFLVFFHLPLPWDPASPLQLPFIYIGGVWVSIICTLAFTAIYAFRVAEETRKLADALSATELVLQREQHLSALDGLAAAAAHELGTPLATIALVSKEMAHALPKDSDLQEDAALLRSQADRCRTILQKLTSLSSEGEAIIEQQALSALVEEEVAPLRDFGIKVSIIEEGARDSMPSMKRNPGIHYGLGNLIDNAVDFAKQEVVVVARWDATSVAIEVSDDGPGFANSILDKVGEPFLTSRKTRKKETKRRGLGLGLFIAKTLLERSGAEVSFSNKSEIPRHKKGAFVSIVWPRDAIEANRQTVESMGV